MRWSEADLAAHLARTGIPGAPNRADTSAPPFALPARKRGLAASIASARTISDPFVEPDIAWIARFKIPLSWAGSKNSIHGRDVKKHQRPFVKKEARDYRDSIALLARNAVKDVPLKHAKLWIDIFVEKPQQRGDAVNFVDLVCDAIKIAVPIDDRWYSIRRLDWAINKTDPHIFIGLAQEVGAVDSRACSYCGLIKALPDFTNDRTDKKGKGHICITCRSPSYSKGPNKKYRTLNEVLRRAAERAEAAE